MKKILLFILTIITATVTAQIPINTPFSVSTPNPIDTRMTIATLGDTSTITSLYEGLLVHVNALDQFYKYNGATWELFDPGGGSGDVTGPGSATDNAVMRFDGTGGKTAQNSAVTIDDSGNIATSGTVDGRDVSTDGTKLDGIDAGAQVNKSPGFVAKGDTIFRFTRLIEISPYDSLRNEFGGVAYNRETGRIVIAYRWARGHSYTNDEITVAQYSDDLGATWSDTIHVYNQPALPKRISEGINVMYDEVGERFIASATLREGGSLDQDTTHAIVYAESTDGVTWSEMSRINPDGRIGGGDPCIFVTNAHIVRLADSSMIQTAYLTDGVCDIDLDSVKVYVFKSTDNGLTWDNGVEVYQADAAGFTRANEAQVLQRKNGNLDIFIRGRNDATLTGTVLDYIHFSSTDGGATWSGPNNYTPPNMKATKPSFQWFGKNDDHLFIMYRSTNDNQGYFAYSETGAQGTYSTEQLMPQTTGFFLPGDIDKINDNLALIQYTATDTAGVLDPAPTRAYFQIVEYLGGGNLDGSGTTNTVPLWSGGTVLGNSKLTESADRMTVTIPDDDFEAGFEVSNTDGGFEFFNFTGAANSFYPVLKATAKNRRPFLFSVTDDTDGGTFPMMRINADISGSSVSTRTLLAVSNNATDKFFFTADGRIGANTASISPDGGIEVVRTSTQLRLSNVEDTHYTDFFTTSAGQLNITPSGNSIVLQGSTNLTVPGVLTVTGSDTGFAATSIIGRTGANSIRSISLGTGLSLSSSTLNITDAAVWKTGGNAVGGTGILGTTGANQLNIITNNTERARFPATGGFSVGGGLYTATVGVINASVGYRVNNQALSGRYLRGDGTNFVSSTIQTADLPETGVFKIGGNAAGATANLGTTGANQVNIITNNTERARFPATGGFSVGAGTFTAATGVINAATGFRIADGATSGNVLRGNGTNFVSAQLAAADVSYDNATSGLTATNVKAAIDETVGAIPDNITDLTISSDVNWQGFKITNLADGTTDGDAATWNQVDTVSTDLKYKGFTTYTSDPSTTLNPRPREVYYFDTTTAGWTQVFGNTNLKTGDSFFCYFVSTDTNAFTLDAASGGFIRPNSNGDFSSDLTEAINVPGFIELVWDGTDFLVLE